VFHVESAPFADLPALFLNRFGVSVTQIRAVPPSWCRGGLR
jgi:hypothetical protein